MHPLIIATIIARVNLLLIGTNIYIHTQRHIFASPDNSNY